MKTLFEKLETTWVAITYAEAGQWTTAKHVMKKQDRQIKNKEKTESQRSNTRLRA